MNNEDFFNEFVNQINKEKLFDNHIYKISNNGYAQFVKENDDLFSNIVLTDFNFGNIDFGASVLFKSIESITSKSIIQDWLNDRKGTTIRMYEHSACTGYEFFKGFNEELPIKINSKETLERAVELAKIAFEKDIEPFFDYWNSITVFLPWLETKKYDDWPSLYKVLGPKFLEKKMIIWYQTNHPEYEDFKKFNLNRLEKRIAESSNENPEKTKKVLIGFNELIDRLEKTNPIYKWDNSYLKVKPFKGQLPLL